VDSIIANDCVTAMNVELVLLLAGKLVNLGTSSLNQFENRSCSMSNLAYPIFILVLVLVMLLPPVSKPSPANPSLH
jgi:hypothetical protein